MASWNGQYIGNANWQGSPQFATQTQLISSTQGVASQPQLTSTSLGLYNYTTGASNVLQGEINAIVAGGTTALWANYRAINNVDLSGHDLINSRYLSTQDLQVSSINGADIKLFGSTVVVGGVTIVNNTVKAAQVEKTTSVTDTINSIAGAVGSVVDVAQKAVSGALADSGAVLQQVYWGTAAIDQVVDLTNGVVTLATGIQGLINSRQNNSITGGGVPGQTTNVYETINGTTQFQFSTLGSAVTTVFRTTDQQFPNLKLGREIFTSTIIPAGSKVIRSVSDPLALPIISTQTLSTTNYLQSFGQWHAILEPDYNLTISTLKVDSLSGFASLSTGKISTTVLEAVNMDVSNLLNTSNLYVAQNATVIGSLTSGSFATGVFSATNSIVTSLSTNTLSTGSAIISSLNGLPFNSIIKGNDSSFNSLSTNKLSTGIALISSINGLPISAFVTTGDVTLSSISTNTLSTGSAIISSLNGLPISVYINSGDVTFNTVAANKISTARVSISSINDTIYFSNQPYGNDIRGVNGFYAATGVFNTSLTTNGNLVAGSANLGTIASLGITATGNISGTGSLTGNSLTVTNAVSGNTGTFTGTLTAGNLNTGGTLTGTGLNVTGSASVSGVITGGSVTASGALTGASASVTGTATLATANITNGNITNTNTGIINAGSGSLALTYGSITFNGSPYAPTSPGGADITVNSVSTMKISTAQVFLSSINGFLYTPGGGSLPSGLVSTPNLLGLVSTPNLLGLISTPNLLGLVSTPNLLGLVSTPNLLGLVSTPNLLKFLSTYLSSFNNFNISSLFVSSIQARGGLNFSTPIYEQSGSYDINKSYYLTSSSYDAVSSLQNNILNYTYILGLPVGALVSWPFPPSANLTLVWDEVGTWGGNTNTLAKADPGINQKQAQISLPNDVYGGTPVAGTYADFYNQWQLTRLTIYNIGFGVIVDIPWKSTYRLTWTGASWTVNTTPSPIATTNTTNFNITQNINGVAISTSDVLTLTGTSIYMNTDYVYANDVEATSLNTVSLSSFTGNISTMTSYTTTSDYINAYSTTTTWGRSQTLSNTGTISTLNLGANNVVANYITANVNLTAPTITVPTGNFTNLNTQNINNTNTITSLNVNVSNAATNGYLYADSAYTSTFGIQSGLAFPYTLSQITYSNVEVLSNVLNVPTTKALTHNENMYITSPNPSYSYNGTATVTFKTDGSVDIGGTTLTTFGWQQGTFTARKPIILNISTPSVNTFASNAHLANLITISPGTIAFYTSGGGFAGNIPSNTSLALNYTGSNFTTGTFSNLDPVSFTSYIQTKQSLQSIETVTNVSTVNNAPYIGFGSKGYQIDTFQIRLQGFLIAKTAPNGSAYGFADNGTRITNPITGRTYLLSEWNCIVSLAGHNCYKQVTLAVNEAIVTTQNDGGYWKAQAYMTTATIPLLPGGDNFVYWNVAVTMIPVAMGGITGLQTAQYVGDVVPSTIDAFNPWAIDTPLANLSTVTASTFQVKADTNISLNAGLGFPTFLGTGSVSINASTNIDLMANYDIILGAYHNISMTASNALSITSPNININNRVFTTNAPNWTNGTVNTLYGSEVLSGKYIAWSYDNNPGTGIYDNNSIGLFAPIVTATGKLDMTGHDVYNINNLVGAGNLNIYAGGGGGIGFNASCYFNSNPINDVSVIQNSSGDFSISIPNQTYFNNGGFVQFNVDHIYMYRGYLDMGNHPITNLSYAAGIDRNALEFTRSFSRLTSESNFLLNSDTGYVEIQANSVGGGTGNIYFTGGYMEFRGNMGFTGSNKYIANLAHIYGDVNAGGGGLAIDYMYGMFFNSAGHNAALYCASDALHMLNFNTGIEIASYCSNGAGNVSLYSASNDVFVATGTGHNVNINGGSNVGINCANPGGNFGIYTSTINATSLLDTNFTTGTGRNININTNSVNIQTGNLDMYGNSIINARNIGSYAYMNIQASADINITAGSGCNITLNNTLNMNGNSLSNVLGIRGTTSNDISLSADSSRILYLTGGTGVEFTSYGVMDIYSYGTTNMYSYNTCNINIVSDGSINLTQTRTGKQLALYGYDVPITGTNTVTIKTNYSTWTGSNNFNILGSNIGITSSNAFDIVASGSGVLLDGDFKRKLSGTNISQPIIQYGTATGSGASGSVTVTLPVAYTSATSYVVTASMMDTTAARMSVNRNSASSITIYWFQAGSGSQTLGWNTMGL